MSSRKSVFKLVDAEFWTLLDGDELKIASIQIPGLLERTICVSIDPITVKRCVEEWQQKSD